MTHAKMYPRHLLRAQDFTREGLDDLFRKVRETKQLLATSEGTEELRHRLPGKVMHAFFAEESTRTRFSFCTAAARLGMTPIWCENAKFSSMGKAGETLEDTVECLLGYGPDILVLRHPDDDAAERAAFISDQKYGGIPVINAGSGKKHHPTQTRLDLFTVDELLGGIDGKKFAIGADVFYSRVARSFAYSLCAFKRIEIVFVSPNELAPPTELLAHLKAHGVSYTLTTDLMSALREADVTLWGRLQVERVEDVKLRQDLIKQCAAFQIGPNQAAVMPKHALLLHPQPISEAHEITELVKAQCPNYKVPQQSANGLPVRMVDIWERLRVQPI